MTFPKSLTLDDDHDPALPAGCYSKTSDGQVVVLIAGMSGYCEVVLDENDLDKTVQELNEENGVTVHQANAMRVGAIHGWQHPAAYVAYWEDMCGTH